MERDPNQREYNRDYSDNKPPYKKEKGGSGLAVWGAIALAVVAVAVYRSYVPMDDPSDVEPAGGSTHVTAPENDSDYTPASQEAGPATDDMKADMHDQKAGEIVSERQNGSGADQEITSKIRQAIMEDKSLSTNARNIDVVTRSGVVTIKGSVNSESEEKSIVAKARAVAGDTDKVTDEISVTR